MYFKLTNNDGKVVDLISDPIIYIKTGFKGIPVRSDRSDFFGVLGDVTATIWAVKETEGYELVESSEISDTQYRDLKMVLLEGLEVIPDETDDSPETDTVGGFVREMVNILKGV